MATAFCAERFTIAELHQVYEAVWGVALDPRNFYRKLQGVPGFIVAAGEQRRTTKGRPARLFRAGPCAVLNPPLVRPDPLVPSATRPRRDAVNTSNNFEHAVSDQAPDEGVQ